jgi:RimJ/RimL family protein N-acetyltransferase
LDIAFEEIKFNKLTTETFDIRPITLDILNKNKFKLEGRLKKHVKIENHFYDSLLHGILRANYIRYNKITNS